MTLVKKLLAILILLPLAAAAQVKYVVTTKIADWAQMDVPVQLQEMSQAKWVIKYHDTRRPVLVFTDNDAEVNLMADTTRQPASESQLEEYKKFRMDNLKKTRTDIEFLQDGATMVNGKKIAWFKFMSQATDTKIFNYYFFTIAKGKILFFTFNCIEALKAVWEKRADDIVASVKTN